MTRLIESPLLEALSDIPVVLVTELRRGDKTTPVRTVDGKTAPI